MALQTSFVPVGPNLAAKAARKPCLGRSRGALGTLVALLEPSWGLLGRPGPLLGVLGGGFGTSQGLIWTFWTMSVALREIQQKHYILQCFWASRASQMGSEIAPKSARETSWTSRGTKQRSGGPKLRYTRAKLSYIRRFWTPCRGTKGLRDAAEPTQLESGQAKIPSICSYMD